jgi:DNA polymerase-3 subunit epsilon/CBS domain-containing protein
VASGLLAEGVSGREIAALVSHELAALTRRAAQLAETRMKMDGEGDPPCAYAVAVLGSAGRGESLLALDQDNALVFAEGAPDGPEDRWFARLGGIANDILHQAGVPYCKGGVMARNPQWRGSVTTWRDRIEGWIRQARPEDLLSVDIFFDLRSVHGEAALANGLWRLGFEAARGQVGFARLLAEAAPPGGAAFNLFGRLRTEQGRIDLKRFGLFGIVSAARILAIRHHVLERSTPARLAGIAALGLGAAFDLAALDEAHGTFIGLILGQQIDDIEHGLPAGNAVTVKRLPPKDYNRMRTALDAVRHLDEITRDLLFKD